MSAGISSIQIDTIGQQYSNQSWDMKYKKKSELEYILTCIVTDGEGNGNPLQYSCLENPVDGGAWWAAVHRVAQSQTRLKQLSMHACTGEGNGNSLQHSCLENPRDGGAWWDAIYGVTQSWTWLSDLAAVTTAPWFMFSLSYMNLLLLQDISLNWATPSGLF